jgi:hypothetical protein
MADKKEKIITPWKAYTEGRFFKGFCGFCEADIEVDRLLLGISKGKCPYCHKVKLEKLERIKP